MRLTVLLQYEYTGYSPLPRHERLYSAQSNVMVPSDMCYPDPHHLSGTNHYGQSQMYGGSPMLLPAGDGNKGLCATQSSQPSQMPPGFLNHYVRLHSSFR